MIELPFELTLTRKNHVFCQSLESARDTFLKFIDGNALGSSDLQRNAGDIKVDGKVVARISYNGRVWTPEKYPLCKEITLTKGIERS